ncbi:hypothetical protein HDU96_007315 [Phlyctochytrium bullatum]|nr:hypothetical protein HDU96_007315 [Phlyctochytrium bullatum]
MQDLKRKRPSSTSGKKFNPLLKSSRKKDGSVITTKDGQSFRPKDLARKQKDEVIGDSDDDLDLGAVDEMDLTRKDTGPNEDELEEAKESAAQKRLRLAKRYISKVQETEAG